MHLDAERAADVLAQDAHLRLGEPEMLGDDVLHHVRRLGALVDRQAGLAGIPVGDHGARLERHARVAAEMEGRLDDCVGLREGGVHLAGVEQALEGEIIAEIRVDDGRLCIERRLHVGDGLELLVLDVDPLGRILRRRPRLGDDGRHRLALPAGALHGDGVLRRRFQSLQMRQHADPGRAYLGQLGARDDRDDARHPLGISGVDRGDAGMGVRRAQVDHMRHARQHHVADILPPALHQAGEVRARHGAADIAVRPVEHRETRMRVVRVSHAVAPARLRTVASTASTMA